MNPRILRYRDAAVYLGVSKRTLENWVAEGRVPTVRWPGSRMVRFDVIELDRWIAEHVRREQLFGARGLPPISLPGGAS